MFSSNPAKIFVIAVTFAVMFPACQWWNRITGSPTPEPTPFTAQKNQSDVPFSTEEPENFQAEILVTIHNNGEKTESKTFIARNAEKQLIIFNAGTKEEISQIKNGSQSFTSDPARKIFFEMLPSVNQASQTEDNIADYLRTELLNEKDFAAFERVSAESGVTIYRVILNESKNSESLIYYDENLKLPVKQEFYSISGEQKTLLHSAEIKNFKASAEDKLFEIPKDYKKMSVQEFYRATGR